jgi:hypothetical protein
MGNPMIAFSQLDGNDKVKTEYSEDDLTLDPDLATILLNW